MVKRLVALDPGGTTGWAMYTQGDINLVVPTSSKQLYRGVWDCGQLGPGDHHDELMCFLKSHNTQDYTVICESFEFRQQQNAKTRSNIELISKEYIGVTKLFQQQSQTPVVFQTAGKGKGFIPDKASNGLKANEKLKVIDLWWPGQKHAMDAMRHLVTYMVQQEKRYDIVKEWQSL